jgi:hypothetical protein
MTSIPVRHPCPATWQAAVVGQDFLWPVFDHLNDRAAAHVLSAFACEAALILAHQKVRGAPEEIPAARALIEALGVRGVLFTAVRG